MYFHERISPCEHEEPYTIQKNKTESWGQFYRHCRHLHFCNLRFRQFTWVIHCALEERIYSSRHVFQFFFLHSSIVSKCLFHWCTSFLTTWNTFWISVHVLVSFHSQPRITREAVLMRSPQDQTGLGACLWEIILSAGQSLSPLWTARSRVPVCVVYALSTDSLAYTIRHNFSLKLKINIGKKLVSRDTTRNNFVKCVVYCQ